MRFLLVTFLFLISMSSFSQDERSFRELFRAELDKEVRDELASDAKYVVNTPLHKIDLDGDHRKESIFYEFKDGKSWIHFLGYDETRLKSFKLEVNGFGAKVYKIRVRQLSKDSLGLVFFFYEGMTKYTELNSTVRLYFVTIDHQDLNKIYMEKGPIFWQEKRTQQGYYFQRPNELSFVDFNRNGTKEILVKQGNTASVFMYLSKGKWLKF
ncbi:putative exported protein [Halobacteriovorax marinus SJ]|uniref:Exported protein n=1 Tax=Halobacteriovorax marinus (strain ATCC BAA-682 / DSM 15412 / SJ) TaxID=862908 RepID=E1X568_HALMS|nr:hypothetical protein [Halobacteriovorax marinus]CBW25540.1 putative exported protein [Halobacteriovorax marinus SJ]